MKINIDWNNPFANKTANADQQKKDLRNYVSPIALMPLRQDVKGWREAETEMLNSWYPHRVKVQNLYQDTRKNGHVKSCMNRRRDMTLLRKWDFVNAKGTQDSQTLSYFLDVVAGQSQNKKWFNDFLTYSWDAQAYGYSLITLGDIVEDAFPDLGLIKRWNVSPDRLNVTSLVYSLSGANFMEEPYKNWHCYIPTLNEIGTSPCGYGFLYEVALYEIFLRNLLGFNGDFVELFAQPFRTGKTNATGEDRAKFDAALRDMGSSGWMSMNPDDQIDFIETALGGTGYNGYDNFEKRLHAIIAKIILGHADAIDSIPGKLGNSGKKSPAEIAMEDKATTDGIFMSNAVNGILLPKMRTLGFNIPTDVRAVLKNDAEIMETNNEMIEQAGKLYAAGLQVDAEYMSTQTGIPMTVIQGKSPEPPKKPLAESVQNKLNDLYKVNNHTH